MNIKQLLLAVVVLLSMTGKTQCIVPPPTSLDWFFAYSHLVAVGVIVGGSIISVANEYIFKQKALNRIKNSDPSIDGVDAIIQANQQTRQLDRVSTQMLIVGATGGTILALGSCLYQACCRL